MEPSFHPWVTRSCPAVGHLDVGLHQGATRGWLVSGSSLLTSIHVVLMSICSRGGGHVPVSHRRGAEDQGSRTVSFLLPRVLPVLLASPSGQGLCCQPDSWLALQPVGALCADHSPWACPTQAISAPQIMCWLRSLSINRPQVTARSSWGRGAFPPDRISTPVASWLRGRHELVTPALETGISPLGSTSLFSVSITCSTSFNALVP